MSNGDNWQRKIAAEETAAVSEIFDVSKFVPASVVYESTNKSASSVTAFDHRVYLEDHFGSAKEFKLYEMIEIFPFVPHLYQESKRLRHKSKKRYIVLNSRLKPLLFISEMKISLFSKWWLRYFVFSLDGTFIMSIDRRSPTYCLSMFSCKKNAELRAYSQADIILHPSLSEEEQTAFHVRLGTGDFIGHWKMVESSSAPAPANTLPLKHVVFDDHHFPVMKAIEVSDDQNPKAPAHNYVEVFQGDFSVAKISHKATRQEKMEFVLPMKDEKSETINLTLKSTNYRAQFPVELHVCDKALILGLLLTEMKLDQMHPLNF